MSESVTLDFASFPAECQRAILDYRDGIVLSPWIPDAMKPSQGHPHPKQQEFLLSPFKEVLFGGAAGGGKTISLLMAAAQYVHVPGYAALLLRKTFRKLDQPSSLIPLSKDWWWGKADWNEQKHRWHFPSGATITFGFLDHEDDVYEYHGASYQCCGFDELGDMGDEWPYLYLFSRLRRPSEGPLAAVPLRMRATANPGGPGHPWIKKRFISKGNTPTRQFIPAKLEDNPSLDRESYLAGMMEMDTITQAQLIQGDWDAYEGGRFLPQWFLGNTWRKEKDFYRLAGKDRMWPSHECPCFVTVDLAASERTAADYTVFLAARVTPENDLLIVEVKRERWAVNRIVPELLSFCQRHGAGWVGIEADGFQVAIVNQAAQTKGMPSVRPLRHEGRGKLVRATPAINRAAMRQIFLPVEAPWLEDFMAELVTFTGDPARDAHDDIVDALAYCVLEMQRAGPYQAPSSIPNPVTSGLLNPFENRGSHSAQDRLDPRLAGKGSSQHRISPGGKAW